MILVLLKLNSFISIFSRKKKNLCSFNITIRISTIHTKINILIISSSIQEYLWQEFRHHYPNHLRLLTSASGCNILYMLHHVKVFLRRYCELHYCCCCFLSVLFRTFPSYSSTMKLICFWGVCISLSQSFIRLCKIVLVYILFLTLNEIFIEL